MIPFESPLSDESHMPHDREPSCRGSENDQKKTHSFAKFLFMCAVFLVAFYFQVTDHYPLKVDIEETDDPEDPMGRGGGYFCGCDLPITDQSLSYVKAKEAKASFNLNVCYDPSQLQDINILMYSNSSADQVESLLESSSTGPTRTMEGFMVEQQAHAITGPLNSLGKNSPHADLKLETLYPGGKRGRALGGNISDFTGASFLSVPTDYSRLAFTYCSNCSQKGCDLREFTQTSDIVRGFERWGDCFLIDDSTNECDRRIFSYQAKCAVYPTERVPSAQIVKVALEEFSELHTVHNISAASTWGFGWRQHYEIALQPSTVYVNHSRVTASEILLRFRHVDPESASWLYLSKTFPSLESSQSCSNLNAMNVCTSASVCNLFMSYDSSLNVKCLDLPVVTNVSLCKTVFEDSTLENAGQLCEELGVTSASPGNCTCRMKEECHSTFPYLATWNTSKSVQGDLMNDFLTVNFLDNEWTGRSAPCRNKYKQVIPYNPGAKETAEERDYREGTLILEGKCSENPDNSWKGMGSGRYCWLTGNYRNFTDTPADAEWAEWKNISELGLSEFYSYPNATKRFVCYRIRRQRTLVWAILILGAAFGWAGSVDLIFNWIDRFRQEFKVVRKELKEFEKTNKDENVSVSSSRGVPVRTTSC